VPRVPSAASAEHKRPPINSSNSESTSHSRVPAQRVVVLALVVLALAATAGLVFIRFTGPFTQEPLPTFWPAPTYQLVDQQGRAFGSSDVAGRVAVYSFVYTNCPDTCPLLTATMAGVQERLRAHGLLGSRVQLVSITVDPDRDTPQVLAEYAARFRADPDAWRFLSGERAEVFEVLAGFRLNTVEVAQAFAGADVIPHSNRFAIADARGQVRANLQGEQVAPDDVVSTIRRLLS
jgi:protein SCO1/2